MLLGVLPGMGVTTAEPTENVVDLSTLTGEYEAKDGDVLTGTLAGSKKITVADGATVTLRDADITSLDDSATYAGITLLGDAKLVLEGTNKVKGGYENYPGIFVPVGKTLTIDGEGSLEASSNGFGTGIGGGYEMAAGNIVIDGGTITANGGVSSAGIGGNDYGACGDITINGGTITANGGQYGSGIGSGAEGSCGNITISGGTITVNGGEGAAGIGAGYKGSCGDIAISGGTVTAAGGFGSAGIGGGYNGTCGTVTIADTVTKVVATAGSGNTYSIGAGSEDSTCGTVTVMGVEGAITTSPYTVEGTPVVGPSGYLQTTNADIAESLLWNVYFHIDGFDSLVNPKITVGCAADSKIDGQSYTLTYDAERDAYMITVPIRHRLIGQSVSFTLSDDNGAYKLGLGADGEKNDAVAYSFDQYLNEVEKVDGFANIVSALRDYSEKLLAKWPVEG